MIKKEFIEYLSEKLENERKELLEKDLVLQGILLELSKDEYFKEHFAFKGGTCLTKCYLGYYRFSEDLDFSYINQEEFNGISDKKIRAILSKKINALIELLYDISKKYGLEFDRKKSDSKYFEFGAGNKFVTFKLWYNSSVLSFPSFVKIQINFVEKFLKPFEKSYAKSLVPNLSKEIKFLFPEYSYLLSDAVIKTYSIEEILIEKMRAILTRKSVKTRDFVDVFLIVKKTKINLESLKQKILIKTRFMLKYEKYAQNIRLKEEEIKNLIIEEEKLLLLPLSEDFPEFVKKLKLFIYILLKEAEK
jgi:predicted nucleotidyltransferase component of viral defense system